MASFTIRGAAWLKSSRLGFTALAGLSEAVLRRRAKARRAEVPRFHVPPVAAQALFPAGLDRDFACASSRMVIGVGAIVGHSRMGFNDARPGYRTFGAVDAAALAAGSKKTGSAVRVPCHSPPRGGCVFKRVNAAIGEFRQNVFRRCSTIVMMVEHHCLRKRRMEQVPDSAGLVERCTYENDESPGSG
jgi:hypothetical protein